MTTRPSPTCSPRSSPPRGGSSRCVRARSRRTRSTGSDGSRMAGRSSGPCARPPRRGSSPSASGDRRRAGSSGRTTIAAAHARSYAAAGAAAISVLTEPTFFDGAPEHLRAVRDAVNIPVLRKDFIVTEYQVYEAVALGADAALLIVGALTRPSWSRCWRGAAGSASPRWWKHTTSTKCAARSTPARASSASTAATCERWRWISTVLDAVAAVLPDQVIAVAESGITSRADMRRSGGRGIRRVPVGERLITQPDPGAALRACGFRPGRRMTRSQGLRHARVPRTRGSPPSSEQVR